jgi:hypothetical protein
VVEASPLATSVRDSRQLACTNHFQIAKLERYNRRNVGSHRRAALALCDLQPLQNGLSLAQAVLGYLYNFYQGISMKIEIPGELKKFSNVPAGAFFRDARSRDFSLEGKSAAIIFPDKGPHRLQVGGLPNDVVCYPDAILRAVSFEFLPDGEMALGAVIRTAGGNSYVRVADGGLGQFRTFDLQTGLYAPLADDASRILYADWKIGILVDGKFVQMFSWPTLPATP